MLHHVILWKIKEDKTEEEKIKIREDAKKHLEALVGKVPGLLRLEVETHPLETSTADLMLDSVLESQEALAAYAVHPEHVKVADTYVRPYMSVRMCLDYEK